MSEPTDSQDLNAERAAAPTLAAKYDAACRSVADLHAELREKQNQITAISKTLQDVRSRIPRGADRTEQKPADDLEPGTDALVLPSWMAVTSVQERNGMLRVHGWTTVNRGQTVAVRPAPGTPESARWAMEELGIDEDDE